jgi:ribosome-binding factor A
MILKTAPKGPSQRQKRVAEEIRHIMAGILTRGEFYDAALTAHTVTITRVSVSPDLKQARAFISLLGGGDVPAVLAALKAQAPFFRTALARALPMKYVPKVSFALDETLEKSLALEALFHSKKVAQDLGPKEDATTE